MDRRSISVTAATALFGCGAAALIGFTALPEIAYQYSSWLWYGGEACIILSIVGIVLLYTFQGQKKHAKGDAHSTFAENARELNYPDMTDKPALHLAIDGANVFQTDAFGMENFTGICLNSRIWNTGTPSAVTEWKLTVKTKDGQSNKAFLKEIPPTLTLTGQDNIELSGRDSLISKTESFKVEQTPIKGLLLFYADIERNKILDPDTVLSLSAKDIYGTSFKVDLPVSTWMTR